MSIVKLNISILHKAVVRRTGELNPLETLSKSAADLLAQLDERRSAERKVAGSNPGRTNTQDLKMTEG